MEPLHELDTSVVATWTVCDLLSVIEFVA
jgi:hypothetical protein